MKLQLFDVHCHLDLMAHPDAVADEATALGLVLFDCGVDPHDFARAKKRACSRSNIFAGIGLHPWWLADGPVAYTPLTRPTIRRVEISVGAVS